MHPKWYPLNVRENNILKPVAFPGVSFVTQSVFRLVHRLFQSDFYADGGKKLPFLNFQYSLLYITSTSSCLRLLPLLPVTYTPPCTYPSIVYFKKHFLHKMCPIQSVLLLFIVCTIFLSSLTVYNTATLLTWSVQLIFSILFQHHISKLSMYFWSTFQSVQVSAPNKAMLQMQHLTSLFLKFKSNLLVKRVVLLDAAFAMEILDLISRVHLASFVLMLPKYLKYSKLLFFINHNICWRWFFSLIFPHLFPIHSIFQLQLIYQSCSEVPFLP